VTGRSRWLDETSGRGPSYDARFEELAASGVDVHGEADLVSSLVATPARILDAGCGTGRVGIELARRGYAVVGVDIDESMLGVARAKAPDIAWHLADLATLDLGETFDAVVMAGNVLIYLAPGTEAKVVARVAAHLDPAGLLIAGFTLQPGRLALQDYDAHAASFGLVLRDRWATWDREPFRGGDYAVSVHVRSNT
jgi:SAM-dependent methyltransferase